MAKPIFLELGSPLTVCTDIHGQYPDLLKLFELRGFTTKCKIYIIGDYVDRGKQSIKSKCLILAFKIKYDEYFLY